MELIIGLLILWILFLGVFCWVIESENSGYRKEIKKLKNDIEFNRRKKLNKKCTCKGE